ncbi:MAG: replication initiator protein A [Catonella sp.]|uniref:replication initiator protein A n=1 Tax=Catonella sp. TaxID=2382125 RepID=UPI003FA1087C
MGNINFSYYYGKEAEQFSFFRIPKLLFTDKNFSSLSSDAKVLYGILLDRMSLSMKNNWIDEENRVYIIFTIEEIEETMNFGKNKSINTMKELENFGLIEKKRRGLGKPNIIYVMSFLIDKNDFSKEQSQNEEQMSEIQETDHSLEYKNQEVSNANLQRYENQNSRSLENKLQEVSKTNPNKTNINNTDFSYTDNNKTSPLSPSQDKENNQKLKQVEGVKKKIRENIDYKSLVKDYADINLIDIIVDIMVESIESKKDLRINQAYKSYEDIEKQFLSIKKEHIRYVLNYLKDNKPKIINFRAYILSLLYNAPFNIIKIDKPKSLEEYYSNDNKLLQELIGGS